MPECQSVVPSARPQRERVAGVVAGEGQSRGGGQYAGAGGAVTEVVAPADLAGLDNRSRAARLGHTRCSWRPPSRTRRGQA